MLRSGLYNISSAVVRLTLGLLTVPLLIRIMGLEAYGLWALVSAIIAVLALAEAGLSIATTVFVARDLAEDDQVGLAQTLLITCSGMLLVATLVAVALWFGAAGALLIPGLNAVQRDQAVATLQLGALVVWTRLLQQVLVGIEQAYLRYGLLNSLLTIQAVLANVGMVCVAFLGGDVYGLMACQAIVGGLMLIAHMIVCWRLVNPPTLRPAWSWVRFRALGQYSLLTWAASLGGALFSQFDRLIVGSALGVASLAIYAAITNVVSQINLLSALPVQPLLPHLGAHTDDVLSSDLIPQLHQSLVINAVIALGLGGSLVMLATPLLRVLLAQEVTTELRMSLAAAVIVYSLYSLNAVGYFVLLGLRAVRVCTTNVLFFGTLTLALIAVGAYFGGVLGAVLGNVGYLGTLYLTWLAMRTFQVPAKVWLRWVSFPVAWFAIVCILAFVTPVSTEWRVLSLAIALFGLGIWFFNDQRASLVPLMRFLAVRQK